MARLWSLAVNSDNNDDNALRNALAKATDGWFDEVPTASHRFFSGTELNPNSVPAAFTHWPWIPIFPAIPRRNRPDVKILGSPDPRPYLPSNQGY